MAQYIDKSDLVAEIEKVADEPAPSHDQQCPWEDGYYCGLYKVMNILDTLEVKEVDFNTEVSKFIDTFYKNTKIGHRLMIRRTAKYFYELGLKTKKGE